MQKYKKKSYCKFVLHLPYLHLIPSLVPPYRRSWFVFSSSFLRLLFICPCGSHRLLFVFCSSFVRLLFVHCSFIVRLLFVFCSSFVRLLFVHCLFIVCLLFVHCLSHFSVTTLPLLGRGVGRGYFVRLFSICLCGLHLPVWLAHLLIC